MPALRGLTVSVGYAEMLRITLIRNMRHFTECLVVTSPEDEATQAAASEVPGVSLFITDVFTRHGARFNKGYALELAFDVMGRHGWIAIWDSDCLWPDVLPLANLRPDCLNGMHRRVLEDPSQWHPGFDWSRCVRSRDGGPIGFTQIVNADDPALRDRRPWYDVSFAHAGGGDAFFMSHWARGKHNVLPCEALHLGPTDTHWFGTDQAGKDMMAKFVRDNGWKRAEAKHAPEAAERAGPIVERVEVPGYEPSTYELPFVKRAQAARAAQAKP